MIPALFRGANAKFGPPEGLDESQVMTIPAYKGAITYGNLDGEEFVTVAWKPTEADLIRLMAGELVYLSCVGGLPPHFLTTRLDEATYGQLS